MKKSMRRASVPAAFGGAGFQPVIHTGKMPVPPRTFSSRSQAPAWEGIFSAQAPLG